VAHNAKALEHSQLLRVRLPKNTYTVETWSKTDKKFVQLKNYDILEQVHFKSSGNSTDGATVADFELYVDLRLAPNEVGYFRVRKSAQPHVFSQDSLVDQQRNSLLEIKGFTDQNEALFNYVNKNQDISQQFGLTLKYWKAKQTSNPADGSVEGYAEGAYLFTPKEFKSREYSVIDPDVAYEQGLNIEQWTIKFADSTKGQYALIKVRFSPLFNDLIEFDVELSSVPVKSDRQGKDVTVNWKMYDGFNANQTFWTDANGLEMQKRRINFRETFDVVANTKQNISSNFYPVTSAIAMRDTNSNKQVTILNDRCQAGAAEIEKSTIELIQHRRLI
jgi:hypothetical protein